MSEPDATVPVATTPIVERLDLPAFERERVRGALTLFSYTPNGRGFLFLQICAAALFLIAFLVYSATGFAERYWILLSGALSLGGIALIALVGYWAHFARTSAVGFDDHHLYVLRFNKPVRIPWRFLTARAAGFTETHPDGNHGQLNLNLGGERVRLVLFNPFVVVDNFPNFLVELLTQIKRNGILAPDADPADPQGT